MIKPTVGRVVWYYPTVADAQQGAFAFGVEHKADVVAVWSDTCVQVLDNFQHLLRGNIRAANPGDNGVDNFLG